MRILLVCHGMPPDSLGGVEQHVSGLACALAAIGHDVEVFARATLPGVPQGEWRMQTAANPRIARVAYRWEGVDSLDATYTCPPMASALAHFVAERRAAGAPFDVAHVHHLTGMSTDALGELATAGIPTVLTLHDYWMFCPRGQMFHRREELCETAAPPRCADCLQSTFPHWLHEGNRDAAVARIHERALRALALPQRLVVPSARVIPPFVALGVPAARFTVVENGVDTEALAGLELPPCGPGPLRLGYLGTVMPSKGLHVLIAALQRLPAGTATLRVHGNVVPYHGDEGYLTRCLFALRPGAGVELHGPYDLAALPKILAAIDVLAAPALWREAFGLTVREALAAGRPVLCSRIGGLQDSVEHGREGLVLPPGDVDAWAAAIVDLARDRARVQRMATAARCRARGFRPMADDLVAVYQEARRTAPTGRVA